MISCQFPPDIFFLVYNNVTVNDETFLRVNVIYESTHTHTHTQSANSYTHNANSLQTLSITLHWLRWSNFSGYLPWIKHDKKEICWLVYYKQSCNYYVFRVHTQALKQIHTRTHVGVSGRCKIIIITVRLDACNTFTAPRVRSSTWLGCSWYPLPP